MPVPCARSSWEESLYGAVAVEGVIDLQLFRRFFAVFILLPTALGGAGDITSLFVLLQGCHGVLVFPSVENASFLLFRVLVGWPFVVGRAPG